MIKGVHLGVSSLENLYKECKYLDINTFQIFLRSPQAMKSSQRKFESKDLDFFKKVNNVEIFSVLGHAPFVANGASNKDFVREKASVIINEDLKTLDNIDNSLYVLHPGSHLGDGVDIGIDRLVKTLNNSLYKEQKTWLLLETMAGKGNELGKNFKELGDIINNLDNSNLVGVCLDTCHVWDAGYNLEEDLDNILLEFDDFIGLDRLKAIHLNNSLNKCGSHKDRHANLYNGEMSSKCFENILNHNSLKKLPFYLETPINTIDDYKKDLEFINNLIK